MTTLNLQSFNKVYPQVIQKFSSLQFDPDASVLDKINHIVNTLNQVGKLTNDVVNNWNQVYTWTMNDGLVTDVQNTIETKIAAGEFTSILNSLLLTDVGDLTTLHTTMKTNLVGAINEVKDEAETNKTNIATNTTNIASNTTNIASNTSSLADIAYDAKNHGLIGDGVTDETNAFNALVQLVANAGGGTIYLPKGVYKTTAPVTWQSKVSLKGQGMGLTILKPYGKGFSAIDFNRANGNNSTVPLYFNCNFENFEIDGTNFTNTNGTDNDAIASKGIFIQYMSNSVFRDLYIHDTVGTGLGADFLHKCVIDNVITYNCGRLWQSGGLGQAGIGIGTGSMTDENFIITNCQTYNSGQFGIFIEDQHLGNPPTDSITLYQPKGMIISNNIVRNGLNDGICVRGGDNVVVSNNVVYGNARYGISVSWDVNNLNVIDNIVTENTNDGVYISGDGAYVKTNIQVRNNQMLNNGGAGCRFYTAGTSTLKWVDISGNLSRQNLIGIKANGTVSIEGLTINDNRCGKNKGCGIEIDNPVTQLEISRNKSWNNGQDSSQVTKDGINIGATITNFQINDNWCFDNQATKTQNRGIVQASSTVLTAGKINGNYCTDSLADGIIMGSQNIDVDIRNNKSNNNTGNGIYLSSSSQQNIRIHDNTCYSNIQNGIFIDAGNTKQNISVKGNNLTKNTSAGFRLTTAIGTLSDITVSNNIVDDNLLGIKAISGGTVTNFIIENNKGARNKSSGIELDPAINGLKINNNTIFDNGQDSAQITRDGIRFTGNVTGLQIFNNWCYDDQGTPTQQRGIVQGSSSTVNYGNIQMNDLRRNATGALVLAGTLNTTTNQNNITV